MGVLMSFADPQTVTISGAAQTLARIGYSDSRGSFQKSDGLVGLTVGTSRGKRLRHTLRLDHAKIAADPFVTTMNARYSMSVYLVVDRPMVGYTLAEAQAVVDGFTTYLTASSSANVTKMMGGEL